MSPRLHTAALLALLVAALSGTARAESDACTYGQDRDIHDWLSNPKGLGEIFCGKKARADAEKTAKELKKRLLKDGYHVTAGPKIEEIPVGGEPTLWLAGAFKRAKCGARPKQVLTVCASLEEDRPLERVRKALGDEPAPPPARRDPKKEGQTRVF